MAYSKPIRTSESWSVRLESATLLPGFRGNLNTDAKDWPWAANNYHRRPSAGRPCRALPYVEEPARRCTSAAPTAGSEARPMERRIDTLLRIGPSDGEDFLLDDEAQGRRDA